MELSIQEMKETQGVFAPYVIAGGLGGIYGGLGYLGSSTATGNFRWSGFGTAIGVGVVSGLVGGGPIASAAGRYLAPRVAYFGGFMQGRMP